jgi:ribonuclease Y
MLDAAMIEVALTAVASATAAAVGTTLFRRRGRAAELARAEADARGLRAEAEARARTVREAALAEGRARAEELRAGIETDRVEAEAELAAIEERLEGRAKGLEGRSTRLQERDEEIEGQFDALKTRKAELDAQRHQADELALSAEAALERAAGIGRDAVRDELRREMVEAARLATQRAARQIEDLAAGNAEIDARRVIDLACGRYGVALPAERLVTTVTLPEAAAVRERLLGDNRALLAAITAASSVEFIPVDGDDDTLYLQAPDPFTREVGRLAFERLAKQKKPDESQARRVVGEARAELDRIAHGAGKRAADLLGLKEIHPEIRYLVGKLLYRTSYTQNQWQHAIETAYLAGMMAEDLGIDVHLARRAALLHDIGKVLWAETEAVGSHAVSGAAFARERGEPPEVVHPIAAHHNDEKPSSALAHLVAGADALSGARPGARRETEEAFSTRVEDLERICADFGGVDKAYVIQGGREVRVVVDPHRIDDLGAARLSFDLARRIEDEMTYPGQIKVTVIRSTRVSAVVR